MDPNTLLAEQLKQMGFDFDEMDSTIFSSKSGKLFKGNYIDKIPCQGALQQYGDFIECIFHETHPIDRQPTLSGITINLLDDLPFPVVSHRYEKGCYPVREQIIEQMYQLAKAAAISKKFDLKESTAENKTKKSHKP